MQTPTPVARDVHTIELYAGAVAVLDVYTSRPAAPTNEDSVAYTLRYVEYQESTAPEDIVSPQPLFGYMHA